MNLRSIALMIICGASLIACAGRSGIATSYGSPNPKAPEEITQFNFLIGEWDIDFRWKLNDGSYQQTPGHMRASYVLDGYAIQDVWRLGSDAGGQIIGLAIRTYNPREKKWAINWVDGTNGVWGNVGKGEFTENGEMVFTGRNEDA